MRVLIFNWVPFDDIERRGGGVTVYIANLIDALLEAGHEIIFVSSGTDYDLLRRRPRIRQTKNTHGKRVRSYSIVNSEVCAPGHSMFGDNETIFIENGSFECFRRIMLKEQPIDVVHINNLEGVSARILALKEEFPKTKFVYSAHNYFALCSQVNLWRSEQENCPGIGNGQACLECVPAPAVREWKLAYALSRKLGSLSIPSGSLGYRLLFHMVAYLRPAARIGLRALKAIERSLCQPSPTAADQREAESHELSRTLRARAKSFVDRRRQFVQLINTHCDIVHAVSHRTRDVLEREGIDATKLRTSYIGTKVASQIDVLERRQILAREDEIHIAYLGYMRRDKGFYFLLDALEQLEDEVAERISFTVAAKMTDLSAFRRLEKLAFHLQKVTYFDGYRHTDLDHILRDVDVGVVPVLWEDNLPQVAIEMVGKGLPIITSDLGGAQELCGNKEFIFDAGNVESFLSLLTSLMRGKPQLAEFWVLPARLPTIHDATAELLDLVLGGGPAARDAPEEQKDNSSAAGAASAFAEGRAQEAVAVADLD